VNDDHIGPERANDRHGFVDRVDRRDREMQLRKDRLAHVAARGVLIGDEDQRRETGAILDTPAAARLPPAIGSLTMFDGGAHGAILLDIHARNTNPAAMPTAITRMVLGTHFCLTRGSLGPASIRFSTLRVTCCAASRRIHRVRSIERHFLAGALPLLNAYSDLPPQLLYAANVVTLD